MKHRTIYFSVGLVLTYSFILCCTGVFGTSISSWFMSWVPMAFKIFAVLAGFLFVSLLPFRVERALESRRKLRENFINTKKLAILERKQKIQDKNAKIMEKVNLYE